MRTLKIQQATFMDQERELSQEEYKTLVKTAQRQGNERLVMLLQTICATGIRVSEVRAVTVEALRRRQAEIRSKGKIRLILLPDKLCRQLLRYCEKRNISSGQVFVTRTGRPLDRSNIWKMMKRLAAQARVGLRKAFPHSLRHLFACTYYQKYKDIVRLADILGHSSVDTTRIYTAKNVNEQQRQLEYLNLLICV